MDLLKIILNPLNSNNVCFLCFKVCCDKFGVHQKLNIYEEFYELKTTLFNIVKYLFPSYEIILKQACNDCVNLLLQVYTKLRRNIFKKEKINSILQNLSNEVNKVSDKDMADEKIYIKLFPELDTGKENLEEFHLKVDQTYQLCSKCDMKFDSHNSLQQHDTLAHNNKNKGVICEFCGKECKTPQTLQVHLNCHKEKACPHCSKTLKLHSHFKLHVKRHQEPHRKKVIKTHYSCEVCSFRSYNKKSLEAHLNKVHLRLRPYVCEICKKGFYKKSNLTEHIITHNENKEKMCELCGEQFVCKKTLTEHLRLHSGEKPFECEICNERFVTSGRRSDHFKRKHMEKTITCFVCDKKFSLRKDLNRHMKNIHNASNNSQEMNTIQTDTF